jgi:hypothetical protein
MGNAQFFTSPDICGAYHSLPLAEKDKEKFAFITHLGLFECEVLPYGFVDSGPIFSSDMNAVFGWLKWNILALLRG